jgi:ArsR family transcriptional regulator, arsenate/arsenite/antimonite-responsive transcriptional repressor
MYFWYAGGVANHKASANANANVPLEVLFNALADRTRLRLINLMAEQEICVCYFIEVLGAPQSKISRHLAYLRKAGIVAARREGKWMHYRLVIPAESHAADILRITLDALRKNKDIQRDFDRLNTACCGPRSLVQVIGAPLPERRSSFHRD